MNLFDLLISKSLFFLSLTLISVLNFILIIKISNFSHKTFLFEENSYWSRWFLTAQLLLINLHLNLLNYSIQKRPILMIFFNFQKPDRYFNWINIKLLNFYSVFKELKLNSRISLLGNQFIIKLRNDLMEFIRASCF